jgi:hypothetical protein
VRALLAAASLGIAAFAPGAHAQQARDMVIQPAARVDVFVARITAVQAGIEGDIAAGRYVRLGMVGAVGGSWHGGASGVSARSEVVGRFLVDPDFITRWAPYAGAGLGVRYDRIADWRGVLIAVLGVEGPDWGGVVPFIEAGYGGGARVGVGLRRRRAHGR